MRTCLLYVFPQVNQPVYGPAAKRFATSYMENPPGEADHEIVVCINGGTGIGPYQRNIFKPLPVDWREYNNWGKDLGAFQMAADSIPCDLMIFMGSFVHFGQPGWLDIMVRAYEDYGPALYGAYAFHEPADHIRTSIFWCPPELFNAYPIQIGDKDRYPAEHGSNSITLWARKVGFETLLVTRRGVFEPSEWHHVERQDALVLDQHTDRMGY